MRCLQDSFEIHLLCPGNGLLVENARRENIRIHIIPYFWSLTLRPFFWTQAFFFPANLITLLFIVRLFRKLKFDLVYTNTCVAFSGPLAAKLCNIPHIWHIHEAFGPGSYEYSFPFFSQKAIARQILTLSNIVIVNSNHIRQCFSLQTSKNIQLVYNGFSLSGKLAGDEKKLEIRKRYGLDPDDIVLSIVGSIQKMKGHLSAIRAMPSILKKHPNAKLLIAGKFTQGSYFYKKTIESEIAIHHLNDAIIFLGNISDVSQLYLITDILLVPSLYEPFGRTIVEAAFYKVPCIASNVGGIPEIIENGVDGILFSSGDSTGMAAAVLDLLKDRNKRNALGENASKRIPPRFVMTNIIQEVANIINQTLNSSGVTFAP
ncbi:MAG: glycosyltransferase family 4 protein [Candidatus Ozemobacteraceae bacterium]